MGFCGKWNPLTWPLIFLNFLGRHSWAKWTLISALIGGGLFLTLFCYINPQAVLDTFNIEIADAAEQGIELNLKAGGTVSGVLFGSFWMILGIYQSWQAHALKVVSGSGSHKGLTGFTPPVDRKYYKYETVETREYESYDAEFDCWDRKTYEIQRQVLAEPDLSKKYEKKYGTDYWLLEDLTRLKMKKDHDVKTHWISVCYIVIGLAAITTSCLFGAGIINLQAVGWNVLFSGCASLLFGVTAVGLCCYRVSGFESCRGKDGSLRFFNRREKLVEKLENVNKARDRSCFWEPAKATSSVSASKEYKVKRLEKEYKKWQDSDSKMGRLRYHENLYNRAIKNNQYVRRTDFEGEALQSYTATENSHRYQQKGYKNGRMKRHYDAKYLKTLN